MPAVASPETTTAVSAWLADHPDADVIATYAPLPGEIDLLPLVALHPERRWVFPRVEGEVLQFYEVADLESDLAPGAFGILEPLTSLRIVAVSEIDVFLCPGLAFDKHGGRLGRGRGFYDRILAQTRPGTWKIGICHPARLIAEIPMEAHDIRMDAVVF